MYTFVFRFPLSFFVRFISVVVVIIIKIITYLPTMAIINQRTAQPPHSLASTDMLENM